MMIESITNIFKGQKNIRTEFRDDKLFIYFRSFIPLDKIIRSVGILIILPFIIFSSLEEFLKYFFIVMIILAIIYDIILYIISGKSVVIDYTNKRLNVTLNKKFNSLLKPFSKIFVEFSNYNLHFSDIWEIYSKEYGDDLYKLFIKTKNSHTITLGWIKSTESTKYLVKDLQNVFNKV
jgi:hypothetical protein